MGKRVRRMERRGFQVLLWTAAVFLLIQFGAAVLLERYGLEVRFPQAVRMLLLLQERGNSHDIIVFGSSRFRTGVAMGVVQDQLRELTGDTTVSVFNAAVSGGDLTTTDFLLERILKIGVQPRIAVIEISPENLARTNQWMSEHVRRQVTWGNVTGYLEQSAHEGQAGALARNLCLPLCVHRYQLCQEVGRFWREGWGTWSKPYVLSNKLARTGEPAPPENFRDARRDLFTRGILEASAPKAELVQLDGSQAAVSRGGTETIRDWLRNYEIGGVSAAALERLLARCHRHGIVPVLVMPPLAKVHRGLYDEDINARFLAHLEMIRRERPFALADFRGCLPDTCLIDNHHLTIAGSEVFSTIMVRDLLAPMWTKLRQ